MTETKVTVHENTVTVRTAGVQGPQGVQGIQGETGPQGEVTTDALNAAFDMVLTSMGIIVPPTAFEMAPNMLITKVADEYRTNVDASDYAITGKTYYVGYPGASGANDGLTKETSLASLNAALLKSDVDVVMMSPGTYTRDLNYFNTVNLTRSVSIIGDGGMAKIGAHSLLSWTLHSGTTYKATRSGVNSVWDASIVDANGDYERLTPRASVAEVEANPGSWYLDGSNVLYVQTSDQRVADADVRAYLTIELAKIAGNLTVYLENIAIEGDSLNIRNTSAGAVPTVYAKNCSFKYAHGALPNAVTVLGANTHFQGCVAAHAHRDGYNYHVFNGVLCESVEVDCIGRDNGYAGDSINNGSSTHDAQHIIRINGEYMRNNGPNVVDVGASQSWNLGVYAHASAGVAGVPNCDFWVIGEMWLDGCESGGSDYDVVVGASSTLLIRGGAIGATRSIDPGGTVGSY